MNQENVTFSWQCTCNPLLEGNSIDPCIMLWAPEKTAVSNKVAWRHNPYSFQSSKEFVPQSVPLTETGVLHHSPLLNFLPPWNPEAIIQVPLLHLGVGEDIPTYGPKSMKRDWIQVFVSMVTDKFRPVDLFRILKHVAWRELNELLQGIEPLEMFPYFNPEPHTYKSTGARKPGNPWTILTLDPRFLHLLQAHLHHVMIDEECAWVSIHEDGDRAMEAYEWSIRNLRFGNVPHRRLVIDLQKNQLW